MQSSTVQFGNVIYARRHRDETQIYDNDFDNLDVLYRHSDGGGSKSEHDRLDHTRYVGLVRRNHRACGRYP